MLRTFNFRKATLGLAGLVVIGAVTATAWAFAQPPIRSAPVKAGAPVIAWYGTLDRGLAEAKRSQRPILLVSAAPQCLGVPGIW